MSKNHQLIITQQGTADQLLHGQVINLIIIEGDRKFILRAK
ncbi:hypothetical protein [Xenorhabdus siamensis]